MFTRYVMDVILAVGLQTHAVMLPVAKGVNNIYLCSIFVDKREEAVDVHQSERVPGPKSVDASEFADESLENNTSE